ncbi:MAG: tetratricopeptide repeat protein [Pseudomonadaceae bacterium]|nr:tetratricopeptide repeat protein [Pseudomonadaceae bacterium]
MSETSIDIRGVPVSYGDADALAGFERALLAFQCYVGDPMAELKSVLSEHPDFLLAHLFKAFALYSSSEKRFALAAKSSLQRAAELAPQANPREARLLSAFSRLDDGDWQGACQQIDALLIEHPTDAFALQSAHLMDFFQGDALNLRNRVARVLPHWHADTPGYGYVLSMYAFGLEECNEYAKAESIADQALAINPKDVWGVHAKTHVMEMTGRVDDGIRFMTSRVDDWSPDNNFALHNWWHLCLFYLDKGDVDSILSIFDDQLAPNAEDISIALLDLTALLWRLRLLDIDIGNRMANVADIWATKTSAEAGHYAFNDFHAALAFADCDRADELAELKHAVTAANANAPAQLKSMNTNIGLPLIEAAEFYRRGEYAAALEGFSAVRDKAREFGGSHAQRDVITLSIIESARRAGHKRTARHYLADRQMATPESGLADRIAMRIG